MPVFLLPDSGWDGPELLAGLAQTTSAASAAVVVARLATSQDFEALGACHAPNAHWVLCCYTPERPERQGASLLEGSQGLVPIVELALQHQRQLRGRLPALRRPVSSILGFSRLALNTHLSLTQREYLEAIFASGEALRQELQALSPPSAPAGVWAFSQKPGTPGPALRVLVADDNEVSRTMAVLVLEEQGNDVAVASDGEEVLEILGEREFDLVLMDVQMPKLDGYLTTRAIRDRERGTRRHLPILAVTSYGREGDAELCLAAGMDGFVAKPIREEELNEVMQRVLGWSDEQARPAEHVLNRDFLQRHLGHREDRLERVIRQFLEMLPRQLEDVYATFSRGDHENLSAALHRLKCSALAFDSPRVLEPIARLEMAARKPLGLAESGAVLAELRRELEQLKLELLQLGRELSPSEPAPTSTTQWGGSDRPLRVLLAEDNPINQTMVCSILEEMNCQIKVVENGQLAVEAAHDERFDVILMDLQMPVMDGLEALTLIRQRETEYTPVVVLTASTREDKGAQLLAAGATHYLCKPILDEDLLSILEDIAANQRTPALAVAKDDGELVDVAALGERLQYKLERLARLSQVFDQVMPQQLAELREAVQQGQRKRLESSAYRFKTTLRSLEARRSLKLAQQLEVMGREGALDGSQDVLERLSQESHEIKSRLEQLLAEATILAQL